MTDKLPPESPDDSLQKADGDKNAEPEQPPPDTTSGDAAPADEDGAQPTKRGRGRPKGSKNKPRSAAEGSSSAAQPEKRKRGRPPKDKKPETAGEGGGYDEEPTAVKRPRGRPRKNPEPANDGDGELGATTTKKRGRPPKATT